MKCKRFSVAKRDLLLARLENLLYSFDALTALDEHEKAPFHEGLSRCLEIIRSSLGD